MTGAQLDTKATEASLAYNTKYAEDSVFEDMLSRPSDFNTDCIKLLADMLRKKAYRDGYEQGFKELKKENEELKREIEQLKHQIEKMKCCCHCKYNCIKCEIDDNIFCPTDCSCNGCHNYSKWELAE